MTALNRKLIRDFIHLRGQVVAIALVVACGIAAFIALRSIYFSLGASQQAYYSQYRFADIFASLKRAPESVAAHISGIRGVAGVQTRVVAEATLDIPGLDEPARGRIVSIPERQTPMLNDLHITRGRYVGPGTRDEVIISEALAKANDLHPGDTIAAIINGRWQTLQIVGEALSPEYVYEIRPGDIFPDNRRYGVMWMGREALASAYNLDGAFNDVSVSLLRDAKEADVIERLDGLLARYGGLGAYSRADQVSNYFVSNEINELQFTSTFIPGIFLAVTAFLIHIVLTRLVATQRDQIAVLKAFGYSNTAVGLHYLKMAMVAILGGVVLGLGVGTFFGTQLTALYAQYFRFPVFRYEAGPEVIGMTMLISMVSAGLGAVMAVRRAVSLPPAEAMRPEPPARFRAGLFEKLGLHGLLTPATRIIVRNLERHPAKAFLSTVGIALSISLLVVGLFLYYDAVNRVIDIQFQEVQREDVSVVFNEPRSSQARHDLSSLPGVIRVETFRSVPVRLRYEHRTRRLALLGLESDAELRRIVTTDYQPYVLPPDGMVMTAQLAESLGAQTGDVVTVEVLEGARPTRQVVLAGTVEDTVGLSAYMDVSALNRLMREGETISGAFLAVDSREQSRLYSLLKGMPTVSGVNVPAVALDSFNKTVARTVGTMTTLLVFFSCVIAFGMVYNGARIALSERGRELASLRVLGFTQGEVGVMLLGEQAILTMIAIPCGWLMGYGLSAFITSAIDNDMIRLPLAVSGRTYALSFIVIAAAALLSGLLVAWRLRRLDLIEVLKTRE